MDNPSKPAKQLRRSTSQRMIAGVCSGLAEYLGVDPVVIRVVFAFLTVFVGGGILIYVVLWVVIPEDTAPDSPSGGSPTS